MDAITAGDLCAVIDFMAACVLIGSFCLGWIAGGFR